MWMKGECVVDELVVGKGRFKGMFVVQCNLSSVDSICGIILNCHNFVVVAKNRGCCEIVPIIKAFKSRNVKLMILLRKYVGICNTI